jgi:hypothetical protein
MLPFEVISRSARHEVFRDVQPEQTPEQHTGEWYVAKSMPWDWLYVGGAPLGTDVAGTQVFAVAKEFPLAFQQASAFFPAYFNSLLTKFVQTTAVESPRLVAAETRLERIERALRRAGIECVDEAPQINWTLLEAALPDVAKALGWKATWNIDRDKAEVVGHVSGLDYRKLALQKVDFYEHVAAAVDKETFKGVSFELEPAE